jgi:hypothetical protein
MMLRIFCSARLARVQGFTVRYFSIMVIYKYRLLIIHKSMRILPRLVGSMTVAAALIMGTPVVLARMDNQQQQMEAPQGMMKVEARMRPADQKGRHQELWNATLRRLTNAIDHHERVAKRLNTYIANHPEQNTTTAKATIAKATTTLTEARNDLADAKRLFAAFASAEKPREAFAPFRAKVREVVTQIQDAHKLLRQAIRELDLKDKKMRGSDDQSSTTTNSNTNTNS